MTTIKRYIPAALVAVMGVGLSIATFQFMSNLDRRQAEETFSKTASEQLSAVEKSIFAEVTLLKSLVGFYHGSSHVDRNEFKVFLESVLPDHISVQALEWIPRIASKNRQAYEMQARKDGFDEFRITERTSDGALISAKPRDEYFPVYYIEPYKGNEGVLGFDLASNPQRLAAMEKARDTGNVVASGAINLIQLKEDSTGILLFAPVYKSGTRHETIEQRRQNLEGFALSVIRVSTLISGFRDTTKQEVHHHQADIDLYVYDTNAPISDQLLYIYSSSQHTPPPPRMLLEDAHAGFHHDHDLNIGGRTWKIVARPAISDLASEVSFQAGLALFLSLTITAMLVVYLISASRRAQHIENLIDQRTEQLRLESEKSQDRTERIRTILATVADGIITINEHGIIETFNPAAENIFLYSADEIIGQNIKCLMPEPYRSEHDGYLEKCRNLQGGDLVNFGLELTGQRKDGTTFPIDLAVNEMRVANKHMFTGVVRDISQQKENERIKGEFVSTVSHELRTPLTSIKGSLGLIKSGVIGDLPKQLHDMLDIAYNNCDRLVRLINDILDIEKITAGKMEFQMAPLNVCTLLGHAITANQAYADTFEVRLVLNACPKNAMVEGDQDRLMQVLANLLSNASKFSPRGGDVIVTGKGHDTGYRISVQDFGPGIPEEFHEKLFQRFSQADASDDRQKGGTGLGLSITQSIVEHHQGQIGFETEVGTGTTFYFDLPQCDGAHPDTNTTSKPETSYRVLICEDEPDIAKLLQLMLEKENYITHTAHTATEARKLLTQYTFDAMTLDIGLPDTDGLNLIHELRADPKTHDLPLIVVSADAAKGEKRLNGDGFGIIDWIEKPIDQNRLSADLRRAINFNQPGKPRILHLEDDPDVLKIVAHLAHEIGDVIPATNLEEARRLIQDQPFDLVILDLMLPDGNGESLLPLLKHPNGTSTPVIVFSAKEISTTAAENIRAALIKSQTSNQNLLNTIRAAIEGPIPHTP